MCIPSIDIVQDHLACRPRVMTSYIHCHPFDEVIFKRPLNELVQDVGGDKLVNIGTGEFVCEKLGRFVSSVLKPMNWHKRALTSTSPMMLYKLHRSPSSRTS